MPHSSPHSPSSHPLNLFEKWLLPIVLSAQHRGASIYTLYVLGASSFGFIASFSRSPLIKSKPDARTKDQSHFDRRHRASSPPSILRAAHINNLAHIWMKGGWRQKKKVRIKSLIDTERARTWQRPQRSAALFAARSFNKHLIVWRHCYMTRGLWMMVYIYVFRHAIFGECIAPRARANSRDAMWRKIEED